MEFKEFAQIFAESLDLDNPNKVKPESKFREFDDWSSLSSLNLITTVDEQYGFTFDSSDIKNAITVGDLFEALKNKE